MSKVIIPDIINIIIENWQTILRKATLAIFIFFVIRKISQIIISKIKNKIISNTLQDNLYTNKLAKLTGDILFIFFMIFNILAIFQVIWFNTAIIMWWISMSLGFAMEKTIGNMISGIMFLTNKKIKIWDFVQFMWKLKMLWTIEEINIRYSVVRTFDKRRVIVPNNIMAKTPIKTFKTEPLIRGEFETVLPRHINVAQIQSLLNQTVNSNKYTIRKEYTTTIILWFSFCGIWMKTFFFVNPQKKSVRPVVRLLKISIRKAFKKYGIKRPQIHITLTPE